MHHHLELCEPSLWEVLHPPPAAVVRKRRVTHAPSLADCVERRQCRGEGGQEKSERLFSRSEWREAGKKESCRGVCKVCNENALLCTVCSLRKPRDRFESRELDNSKSGTRKCRECADSVELRECRGECGETKSERDFSTSEWREAGEKDSHRGVCKLCNASVENKDV